MDRLFCRLSIIMSEPLRYILVGAGGHGTVWARSALTRLKHLDKAVCAAVVDPIPERCKLACEYLDLTEQQVYTTLPEALDVRRSQFVVIAAPTRHHEKLLDIALAYEQHVLCETPMADTLEAAVRCYRKMKQARRKVVVTSTQRFEQDKQTLAEMLRGTEAGRLNYLICRCTMSLCKSPSWGRARHEMNDPVLIEAGVAHLDMLQALAGAEIQSVQAMGWNPPWGEYRSDSAHLVMLQMANGVHALYEAAVTNATALNPPGQEYIRAECERATLELDRGNLRLISGGSSGEPQIDYLPLLEGDAWGAAIVAEKFCDWLRGGPEAPCRLKEHMHAMAAACAASQSAQIGKSVRVDDLLLKHLKAMPKGTVKVGDEPPQAVAAPEEAVEAPAPPEAALPFIDDPLEDILGR